MEIEEEWDHIEDENIEAIKQEVMIISTISSIEFTYYFLSFMLDSELYG